MSKISQKFGWKVEDVLFLHWGGNPEKEICKSWDLLTEILRLCHRSCHQVSLWGYNLKLSKCNQSCFILNDIFDKKSFDHFCKYPLKVDTSQPLTFKYSPNLTTWIWIEKKTWNVSKLHWFLWNPLLWWKGLSRSNPMIPWFIEL